MKGMLRAGVVTIVLLTTYPVAVSSQQVAEFEPEVTRQFDFPLTIRSIMRGAELLGQAPNGVAWSDDSQWIYFQWRPGGGVWSDSRQLYRVPRDGGEPELLDDQAADSLGVYFAAGDLSPDRRQRVSVQDGNIVLVDRRRMTLRHLTQTQDRDLLPSFSTDGGSVFFTRDSNLFELTLDGGAVRQLTDIQSGPLPTEDDEAEGQRAFLEDQQEELFAHIRTDRAREAEQEATRERRKAGLPETLHLRAREQVQGLSVDPSGTYVVVSTSSPAEGSERTIVPDWVTASGYTEDLTVRTKVGDTQGESRVGLLNVETGEMTWLELHPGNEPEERASAEGRSDEESRGKLAFSFFGGWNDAGTHGLIFAVDFDNKNRWLYSVAAGSGELTLLDALYDEAWVAGPCFFGCLGWIPESSTAYFVTEASGFAHLNTVHADGSGKRALTEGEWEVHSVEIPENGSHFLLRTSEGSPFNQNMVRLDFDGDHKTQITSGTGQFIALPSPDGERMAVLWSKANRPAELYVGRYESDAELEQVTVSPTAEWLSFGWLEPEIMHLTARDAVEVPARIYRPSAMGAEPNGAAVIFVHGAGYLQNVKNFFSGYYREYMFHHLLAANGYTVLDIDYRGSAGYGRDWRTAIYRWMGGKDLSDQTDGAAWLVANEGVDPARIGIYGGSYGGFITLMALFTEPDVFTAGAGLRSVTDWAHYNHGYTSRILNQPQADEEAYRQSSPIYFAENFKGHLLMAHGMVDTNVHFSGVVRLAQRLIELGKENWELAVYPVENHGFVEPTSWTDEYRRIFELFERTIGNSGR